jgi:hypothetical protein
MPRMSRAQSLEAPVSLLPLSRPLMTGEVLDAAFRLFRAGLARCLPYSGLAVLVLELPTLYDTLLRVEPMPARGAVSWDQLLLFLLALVLGVALFGVITLRLHAVSRSARPRFRVEVATVLRRWGPAILATTGGLAFPVLLYALGTSNEMASKGPLILLAVPFLWPTALLAVTLPAFWVDGLGPLRSIAQSARITFHGSWRMVGICLATVCMLAVFYLLVAATTGLLATLMGRNDLVLIAAVASVLSLVIGALGVPFVLAVLVVAYEDLKLRYTQRGMAR